jgi:hypothetical protein
MPKRLDRRPFYLRRPLAARWLALAVILASLVSCLIGCARLKPWLDTCEVTSYQDSFGRTTYYDPCGRWDRKED